MNKCVYWFELVSEVSDIAHGPFVLLPIITSDACDHWWFYIRPMLSLILNICFFNQRDTCLSFLGAWRRNNHNFWKFVDLIWTRSHLVPLEWAPNDKTSTTSHLSFVTWFIYLYIYIYFVTVPACFEIDTLQHCYKAEASCQLTTWYLFYMFFTYV